MATVTISLPKSLKELIDHHVLTKGYGNVSEYFRTLLRGAQQVEADARVEALLLEGLGSGDDVPLTREFWTELKTEARQIAEAHLAKKAFVNSAIRPRARVDIIRQFRWYLVEQDTSDTAFLVAASSGDTIEVCPALYPEQLVITKPVTLLGLSYNGVGRVLVQPTTMTPEVSLDGALYGLPVEAVITVMNTKNVSIESLSIDASNNGINGCAPVVTGIHYYNSSGQVIGAAIAGAQVTNCVGASALKVGNGIGILADADSGGKFSVTIQQSTIHDFTRDGILAT